MQTQQQDAFTLAQQTWSEINLTLLQNTLDSQCKEIIQNQSDSLLNRRRLADATKDFKKVPDDQKISEFKNLLKLYQLEIDSITKRSKVAESAYLSIYETLSNAPDPAPLISSVQVLFANIGKIETRWKSRGNLAGK